MIRWIPLRPQASSVAGTALRGGKAGNSPDVVILGVYSIDGAFEAGLEVLEELQTAPAGAGADNGYGSGLKKSLHGFPLGLPSRSCTG
jgi:hypothetical protein